MISTQMSASQPDFYVIGGTLQRDAPSYVKRQADTNLYKGLKQGKFCYVLTSRQMGKSSLMVRTAVRLREEGIAVAVLDLTALGQNLNVDQWYDGLLLHIGRQLDVEDELESFWLEHERLGPLQRWMLAIQEIALRKYTGKVVIFVDEIDAVRSLPFSIGEFFAGIRELYNRRAEDPELERLTFCLLGVASPTDLIQDTRTTPFNIGQRIELTDFTEEEALPLAQGLNRAEEVGAKLLNRILYWTGGHPYLTQRLCQAVAADESITNPGGIDRACESLFLSSRARERDDNLLFVRERMLRSEAEVASLLDMYAKIRNNKRVRDDETNPMVSILHLAGITRAVEGCLQVRNRIYYQVFDREWVRANMPDAELRRQRAAYRKGLLRATAIAAVVIAALIAIGFAIDATRKTKQAQEEARRMSELVNQATLSWQEAEGQKAVAEDQRAATESQRLIALEQKRIAESQKVEAEQQRQLAVKQTKIAEQRRAEAERLRQLAIDQTELVFWENIKDQKNQEAFQNYLKLYPNGKYAELARVEASVLASGNVKGTPTSGAVAGRVIARETNEPIGGVKVTLVNQSSGNTRSTLSSPDGVYIIQFLPPGIYTLIYTYKGYQERSIEDVAVTLGTTNTQDAVALRKVK